MLVPVEGHRTGRRQVHVAGIGTFSRRGVVNRVVRVDLDAGGWLEGRLRGPMAKVELRAADGTLIGHQLGAGADSRRVQLPGGVCWWARSDAFGRYALTAPDGRVVASGRPSTLGVLPGELLAADPADPVVLLAVALLARATADEHSSMVLGL